MACLGLVVAVIVMTETPTLLADMPPGGFGGRTGPFRSCGSGMGTGFAGIGLAWGLMWVGNHFASRVSRRINTQD